MLNEDKIRLMNEIAIYAKREGRRENPAQKYFRGDYVAKHVLQSFFAYTLSAALFLGVFSLYRLEAILSMVNVMDVLENCEASASSAIILLKEVRKFLLPSCSSAFLSSG